MLYEKGDGDTRSARGTLKGGTEGRYTRASEGTSSEFEVRVKRRLKIDNVLFLSNRGEVFENTL